MFWKSATVLQMWDWEVLTRLKGSSKIALFIRRKYWSNSAEKKSYNFQSRPRSQMY